LISQQSHPHSVERTHFAQKAPFFLYKKIQKVISVRASM
jgi:hypothetical protein